MIARLLKEVVKILAWNKLKHEEQETPRLEGAMKRDDVCVRRKGLVDVGLNSPC